MHGTAGDGVGGCCSGTGTGAPPPSSAEEAATHALIEDLRGAALDPTLDQCCQRDLRDRIAAERVRASLQARDRIDARTREAAGAIIRDPARIAAVAAATAAAANAAVIDADCTEDDADEAGELHALRQARLRELRAAAAATAGGGAGAAGYGALNEAAEGQLLALLREPPGRGNLVVHLAVQGHAPCDALDELLATAAAQYRGTYFARCVVPRGSALPSRLGLPCGPPALLAVRQGALLGRAPLSALGGGGGGDVWDEVVLSYLRRLRVLASNPGGGSCSSASDDEGGDDEGDGNRGGNNKASEWDVPCEECGRSYPHKHVRAVYESNLNTGYGDEDASD